MQFLTKHSACNVMNINYNNKIILDTYATKCPGLITDNTLSWKSHFDTITPKVNEACYIEFLSWDTPEKIYYAYFQSIKLMG